MDKKKTQLLLDERMKNFNSKIDNSDFYNKNKSHHYSSRLIQSFLQKISKKINFRTEKDYVKEIDDLC